MDAFTDGTFSIVATLLVLEVRLPQISAQHTQRELLMSLARALPSFVAFALSFLTIVIYWLNHDLVSQLVARYDRRSKYLNLLLLFCICLIPFVTHFIAEYPAEPVAVMSYGAVMLACALVSDRTYRYLAFKSGLMHASVDESQKQRYARTILGAIALYPVAILAALVNVRISIALYVTVPLLYVFLPKAILSGDSR